MESNIAEVSRRLIVCCDGTWQASDKAEETANSNITKLAEAIAPSATLPDGRKIPQIVYYQAGVGTGSSGNEKWYNRVLNGVQDAVHGAAGYGLAENVVEAYHFIAANYEPGTELLFFGFSRGAYTVRALAGMVHDFGVLHRYSIRNFPTFYKEYRTRKPEDWDKYKAEKIAKEELFTTAAKIKVLGCWDTVGALGVPEYQIVKWLDWNRQFKFHRAELSSSVENAFQALALEEHRGTHAPALWHLAEGSETNLVQCWFPGYHISVGGGTDLNNVKNNVKHDELARTSLMWMLSMCSKFLEYEGGIHTREQHEAKLEWFKDTWCRHDVPDSYSWLSINWSTRRSPGQYGAQNVVDHRKDFTSETREFFHPAVRVRFSGKPLPPVLKDWTLRVSEKRDHERSGWEWFKKLPDGSELVIPEFLYQTEEAPITYGQTWDLLVDDPRGRVPAQ